MKRFTPSAMTVGALVSGLAALAVASAAPGVAPSPARSSQTAVRAGAAITGELKQWHTVTLTIDGPQAAEADTDPNPFTDYRMDVTFTHESGTPRYAVPGYFAADGNAAETSAASGRTWRAHLSPDRTGTWAYKVSFRTGKGVAVDESATGDPVGGCDGISGRFVVAPTDKTGRDFRAKGRLTYGGRRYLQFAGAAGVAQESTQSALTLDLLPGEGWWGGAVTLGGQRPFGLSPIDINLSGDNRGNQYAPLLVSSKGRYVWCEKAFRDEQVKDQFLMGDDVPVAPTVTRGPVQKSFAVPLGRLP